MISLNVTLRTKGKNAPTVYVMQVKTAILLHSFAIGANLSGILMKTFAKIQIAENFMKILIYLNIVHSHFLIKIKL